MKVIKIDQLNLFLLLLSVLVALQLPFKLFLFAYAVLGPIHYLTELVWLKQKNYFLDVNKKWIQLIVGLALLNSFSPALTFLIKHAYSFSENTLYFWSLLGVLLPFTTFLMVLSLKMIKKTSLQIIAVISVALLTYGLYHLKTEAFIIATMLLTTLVHVYVFTLLFMFYGARKGKSKIGYLNCFILILVPIILYFWPVEDFSITLEDATKAAMEDSNFFGVGSVIAYILGIVKNGQYMALSAGGIKIQAFIAFAYTYHYLNWFSKTSIIGWDKLLTKKSTLVIFLIWIIALALYKINYALGFTVLFFISILHVFLEYPLNIDTIQRLFGKRN